MGLHDCPPDGLVDAVQGSCVMVRVGVLEDLGLLDEEYFYSWEDVEWCVRLRRQAELRSLVDRGARCLHVGSPSMGGTATYNPVAEYLLVRNMLRFQESTGMPALAVEENLRYWVANCTWDSHRNRGRSSPDPMTAVAAMASAVRDFRSMTFGCWPRELETLPGATVSVTGGAAYARPDEVLVIAP